MIDLSRAVWKKSSYSSAQGNCVEMARVDRHVAVRDSKNPKGPVLVFTPAEWQAFVSGARAGEFSQ